MQLIVLIIILSMKYKMAIRPDVVATKLYNNPDLHWTFFLVNDIDNYYDWHMDNETFEKYINKKYKGYYAIASQTSDILTSTSKFLFG